MDEHILYVFTHSLWFYLTLISDFISLVYIF